MMKRLTQLLLFFLLSSFYPAQSQVSGQISGGISGQVRPSLDPDIVKKTYCDEFLTVYDAFTAKPDATRAGYYNKAVQRLVNNNLWDTHFDIVRLYGCHTNNNYEALINWIKPGTYDATAYNSPTHTIDQGFLFNGTTQYNDNNWVPSVSGVNYTQNSASQILYIRTDIGSNGKHGTYNNTDFHDCAICQRTVSNYAQVRINCVAISEISGITDGSGLWVNTRTANNVNKFYRNGGIVINGTTLSNGVPTHSPYTGAYNDDDVAAGFRADEVFFEAWGAGMNQVQVDSLTNIVNDLATDLGVNVFSPNLLVFLIIFSIYISNRKKFRYEKDIIHIDPGYRLAA